MSADPIETRARAMGWQPKEQFRGDPEKWVPAKDFVERGETFVPYLKANNRKLESQLEKLRADFAELQRASQEQIDALTEYNSEATRERVSAQRKELVAGIKAARDAGDVDAEVALQEKLTATREALAEADRTKKPNGETTTRTQSSPTSLQPNAEVKAAFDEFESSHPWYNEDPMMKAAFIGTMQASQLNSEFQKLSVQEKFAEVAKQVETRFGQRLRGPSRYEGGGGGGGPESGGNREREKGYAELPAEAKAGCARYETKLVGPKKTYKTIEDWQKKFAADYWRNNPNG